MKQRKCEKKPLRKIRIRYSMFSFYWVVGLFIMMGISLLYTLTVYQKVADLLEATESEATEFWVGLCTFLGLCLTFTLVIVITRRVTVKNPIMKILDATKRIGAGDFSVRLPEKRRFRNEYDLIFENINRLAEELSSIETLRPFSGLHSWRSTPSNLIFLPLKSTVLPEIFTSLKPTLHARMSSPAFPSG